jgi:hypothetical protein
MPMAAVASAAWFRRVVVLRYPNMKDTPNDN